MTLKDFKKAFDNANHANEDFSFNDISIVHSKVNFTIQMDRYRQLYYYEITKNEIESSNLTIDDAEILAKDGWKFDKDKNSFIKLIK